MRRIGCVTLVVMALMGCGAGAPVDEGNEDGTAEELATSLVDDRFYTLRVHSVKVKPDKGRPDIYICFGDRACTYYCNQGVSCEPMPHDGKVLSCRAKPLSGVAAYVAPIWSFDTEATFTGAQLRAGLKLRAMDYDPFFRNDFVGEVDDVKFSDTSVQLVENVGDVASITYQAMGYDLTIKQ